MGAGNWPKPGDPNLSNSILRAVAQFGGIKVFWVFPTTNPHAVAHTQLFRSKENDETKKVLLAYAQGDTFFDDSVDDGETYFYWIKIVSVNGTVGDLIGPASATAGNQDEEIIAMLEGKFSESILNQELREKIDLITDISSSISDEEQARLLGDNYITQIVANWQQELAAVDTLVREEVLQRVEDNDALVVMVNGIFAKSEETGAAILQESYARATETTALAGQVNTLQATVGQNTTSVQQVSKVVNGPDGLAAQYMVKTDVNGYVSGYGLYNDGRESTFIVNVDNFAIGSPGRADSFPFMIGKVNGQTKIVLNAPTIIPDVSIGTAMIKHANIDTLQIKGNAVTVPLVGEEGLDDPTRWIRSEDVCKSNGEFGKMVEVQVDWGWDQSKWPTGVLAMGNLSVLARRGLGNNDEGRGLHLHISDYAGFYRPKGRVAVSAPSGYSTSLTTMTLFPKPFTRYSVYRLNAHMGVDTESDYWIASHRSLVILGAKR